MRRKTLTRSKPIPVQLDEPLRERIAAASERMGEPKSTVMRIAMRIGLEALEKAVVSQPGKLSSLTYPPHAAQGVELNEPLKKKAT